MSLADFIVNFKNFHTPAQLGDQQTKIGKSFPVFRLLISQETFLCLIFALLLSSRMFRDETGSVVTIESILFAIQKSCYRFVQSYCTVMPVLMTQYGNAAVPFLI